MPNGTRIGCDNLVVALLNTDDGSTLSYGTPQALPGVKKINVNPNASMETLFYDDGPGDSAVTLGAVEVEIDKNALSNPEKALMLGHTVDSSGALISGANDTPPWLAVGFRSLKSNGKYKYVWLYKGKFMEPEDNNETKGDSINFQTDTIKGKFVKVNKAYILGGKVIKPWKSDIDEEDAGVDTTAISNWFNSVYTPSAAAAIAPTIAATIAAGSVSGSTKATLPAATGRYVVNINAASAGVVHVGDSVAFTSTTINNYVSGADITGVTASKYLLIQDTDANNKVIKSFEKQLAAGDIKV